MRRRDRPTCAAFLIPALCKLREGRGTLGVGAGEIKRLGRPVASVKAPAYNRSRERCWGVGLARSKFPVPEDSATRVSSCASLSAQPDGETLAFRALLVSTCCGTGPPDDQIRELCHGS
jgi:hypothetical protein